MSTPPYPAQHSFNEHTKWVIHELGCRLQIDLPFDQGAVTLIDQDSNEWVIEAEANSALFIIHHVIERNITDISSHVSTAYYLSLNSQIDLLKGAWFGYDPNDYTLGLYAQSAIEYTNATLLYNLLCNLVGIKHQTQKNTPKQQYTPEQIKFSPANRV